jgi:hypothetical protein
MFMVRDTSWLPEEEPPPHPARPVPRSPTTATTAMRERSEVDWVLIERGSSREGRWWEKREEGRLRIFAVLRP